MSLPVIAIDYWVQNRVQRTTVRVPLETLVRSYVKNNLGPDAEYDAQSVCIEEGGTE